MTAIPSVKTLHTYSRPRGGIVTISVCKSALTAPESLEDSLPSDPLLGRLAPYDYVRHVFLLSRAR